MQAVDHTDRQEPDLPFHAPENGVDIKDSIRRRHRPPMGGVSPISSRQTRGKRGRTIPLHRTRVRRGYASTRSAWRARCGGSPVRRGDVCGSGWTYLLNPEAPGFPSSPLHACMGSVLQPLRRRGSGRGCSPGVHDLMVCSRKDDPDGLDPRARRPWILSRIRRAEKVRMIENRLPLTGLDWGMLDNGSRRHQSSLRELRFEATDPVSRGMCSKGWDL